MGFGHIIRTCSTYIIGIMYMLIFITYLSASSSRLSLHRLVPLLLLALLRRIIAVPLYTHTPEYPGILAVYIQFNWFSFLFVILA